MYWTYSTPSLRKKRFVVAPVSTQYRWLRQLFERSLANSRAAILALSILLIFGYPLGVVQRASDDFVELGSAWMPKASELTSTVPGLGVDIRWEAIGSDNEIRDESMRDFRYLLQGEMDSIQAVRYPDLPDKKIMTVARKVHTRRAFANWGGNGSGTYMRELLELVRVCQATLTHVGLLAIGYLLFAVVLGCKLIPFPCPWGGAARGVINVTAIAWVLSYAPRIHDPKEYDYPVLALLLAVAGPVLFFSFTRMPTLRLTLTQGRHALLQLAIGFALAPGFPFSRFFR